MPTLLASAWISSTVCRSPPRNPRARLTWMMCKIALPKVC